MEAIFLPTGENLACGFMKEGRRVSGSFFDGLFIKFDIDRPKEIIVEPLDAKVSFYIAEVKVSEVIADDHFDF